MQRELGGEVGNLFARQLRVLAMAPRGAMCATHRAARRRHRSWRATPDWTSRVRALPASAVAASEPGYAPSSATGHSRAVGRPAVRRGPAPPQIAGERLDAVDAVRKYGQGRRSPWTVWRARSRPGANGRLFLLVVWHAELACTVACVVRWCMLKTPHGQKRPTDRCKTRTRESPHRAAPAEGRASSGCEGPEGDDGFGQGGRRSGYCPHQAGATAARRLADRRELANS